MSTGNSVYKWVAMDRICNSVMTFGGNIFLARLLDPSDFGLLGMVAIFTALAYNISGCGMSDGLINKKDATTDDYSTVFVFNASMGLIFAIIFISCSGLIARFFGHEELKGIMIAIG
ncbi:MAG: oligosaccharide flippase family protein, partial [Muribaculaceae bacterium]|nr:oligosaccharide flippase family protein [Muribaculaceae bacterium]